MSYNFDWNDKLKVVEIKDKEKAKHLVEFIGRTGEIVNRLSINKDLRKYKLRFDDNGQTFYFREDELVKIS